PTTRISLISLHDALPILLHMDVQGKHVNLLDAPGKPEFVGAALGALNAVDTAFIVVSATAGVQVNTRRMFSEAGKRGLGRILVRSEEHTSELQSRVDLVC